MRTVVISQPFLFPWVGLFEQIRLADVFVHYEDVAFSKGSFVNRVQLKSPRGPEWMTIPLRDRHLGQGIRDLVADDGRDWRGAHRTRLEQLYHPAPFGGEMLELVQDLYDRSWPRLVDLLIATVEEVCRYFGIAEETRFVRSSNLAVEGHGTSRVRDIVRKLGGDRYVTGHGAKNYLDHLALEESGIRVEYLDYCRRPYPQLYGPFDPHVSILDLIANAGTAGRDVIHSPAISWRAFLARGSPTGLPGVSGPDPLPGTHPFQVPVGGTGGPPGGGGSASLAGGEALRPGRAAG